MNDLTLNRKGESDTPQDRSERLFIQHDYWYFRTREGMDIGPYDTQLDATNGINSFIEFLNTAEKKVVKRISEYSTKAA
jgi:hypothetical protein